MGDDTLGGVRLQGYVEKPGLGPGLCYQGEVLIVLCRNCLECFEWAVAFGLSVCAIGTVENHFCCVWFIGPEFGLPEGHCGGLWADDRTCDFGAAVISDHFDFVGISVVHTLCRLGGLGLNGYMAG